MATHLNLPVKLVSLRVATVRQTMLDCSHSGPKRSDLRWSDQEWPDALPPDWSMDRNGRPDTRCLFPLPGTLQTSPPAVQIAKRSIQQERGLQKGRPFLDWSFPVFEQSYSGFRLLGKCACQEDGSYLSSLVSSQDQFFRPIWPQPGCVWPKAIQHVSMTGQGFKLGLPRF